MSRITEVRDELHAALVAAVSLPQERVLRQPPAQPVTPCVWVDVPDIEPATGIITITFPVFLVVDGEDAEQVNALDDLAAEVFDGIESRKGWTLDAGRAATFMTAVGSSRAMQFTCRRQVAARTLCVATLTEPLARIGA